MALAWIVLIVTVAIFHAQIAPYDPLDQDLLSVKQWPSPEHWLGTDALGRDVLSRLIYGAPSTIVGVVEAVVVVAVLGIGLGLTAGYFGGAWDALVRQYVDLMQSLPVIVILLAVLAVFGQSMLPAMVALGVLGSAGVARVLRSATLAVREELYISAARLSGLGDGYIVRSHVAPRVIGPIVVQLALFAAIAVLVQTGVAFLGLGVEPPAPTWGGMIFDASASLNDFPWLLAPTGAVVALTILAFGLLGDGVRDASTERWSRPAHGARGRFIELCCAGRCAAGGDPVGARSHDCRGRRIRRAGSGRERRLRSLPGETLGIVGKSGSGKTLTILALIGLLPPGVAARSGWVVADGRPVALSDARRLAELRGRMVGAIFQDPMASLDPCFTIGSQLGEALNGQRLAGSERHTRVIEALERVKIRNPEDVARRFPHQISGGMAQRVGIARALMKEPRILFADEPTTALDVTVQAEILDLLRAMSLERRMAVVMVTHDWGVVADLCDRAMVMRHGRALETTDVFAIFDRPKHPYTRALIAANPHAAEPGPAADRRRQACCRIRKRRMSPPLLEVSHATVEYPLKGGRVLRALNRVSLTIAAGETVGLVGESGSGKSTLGRVILGMTRPVSGEVRFEGEDITFASRARRRALARDIQVVFQDPFGSLNPARTIGATLAEPLLNDASLSRAERAKRVAAALAEVGLPADTAARYPAQFSGGQRQRVAIARAIIGRPKLVVCDEPVSALDLSVQAQALNLLNDLQRRLGLALLFISHDLMVVRHVSHRVAVLYHGEIVEEGEAADLLAAPKHPYTRALIAAAPVPDPAAQRRRRAERGDQSIKPPMAMADGE